MNAIKLPPRNYGSGNIQYGAQHAAAVYCGLRKPPHPIRGEWQHGWIDPTRNIHPELVMGGAGNSYARRKRTAFFVARQDQADYLKSFGYRRVFAVGLPIIYVPGPRLHRMAGSLLVMPIHSIPGMKDDFNFDEYAQYISSIAPKFARIALCIYRTDAEKGNWTRAFKATKTPVEFLEGAAFYDINTLQRMASLFSQFEFVTSNAFGSHVAYASYFGCKVSVAGPPARKAFKKENIAGLTLFKNAPDLLDIAVDRINNKIMEKTYPQFICDPWNAGLNKEWAAWQLGEQHKISPENLKNLLGWNFTGKAFYYLTRKNRITSQGYLLAWAIYSLYRSIGLPGVRAALQLEAAKRKKNKQRIYDGK